MRFQAQAGALRHLRHPALNLPRRLVTRRGVDQVARPAHRFGDYLPCFAVGPLPRAHQQEGVGTPRRRLAPVPVVRVLGEQESFHHLRRLPIDGQRGGYESLLRCLPAQDPGSSTVGVYVRSLPQSQRHHRVRILRPGVIGAALADLPLEPGPLERPLEAGAQRGDVAVRISLPDEAWAGGETEDPGARRRLLKRFHELDIQLQLQSSEEGNADPGRPKRMLALRGQWSVVSGQWPLKRGTHPRPAPG